MDVIQAEYEQFVNGHGDFDTFVAVVQAHRKKEMLKKLMLEVLPFDADIHTISHTMTSKWDENGMYHSELEFQVHMLIDGATVVEFEMSSDHYRSFHRNSLDVYSSCELQVGSDNWTCNTEEEGSIQVSSESRASELLTAFDEFHGNLCASEEEPYFKNHFDDFEKQTGSNFSS